MDERTESEKDREMDNWKWIIELNVELSLISSNFTFWLVCNGSAKRRNYNEAGRNQTI